MQDEPAEEEVEITVERRQGERAVLPHAPGAAGHVGLIASSGHGLEHAQVLGSVAQPPRKKREYDQPDDDRDDRGGCRQATGDLLLERDRATLGVSVPKWHDEPIQTANAKASRVVGSVVRRKWAPASRDADGRRRAARPILALAGGLQPLVRTAFLVEQPPAALGHTPGGKTVQDAGLVGDLG